MPAAVSRARVCSSLGRGGELAEPVVDPARWLRAARLQGCRGGARCRRRCRRATSTAFSAAVTRLKHHRIGDRRARGRDCAFRAWRDARRFRRRSVERLLVDACGRGPRGQRRSAAVRSRQAAGRDRLRRGDRRAFGEGAEQPEQQEQDQAAGRAERAGDDLRLRRAEEGRGWRKAFGLALQPRRAAVRAWARARAAAARRMLSRTAVSSGLCWGFADAGGTGGSAAGGGGLSGDHAGAGAAVSGGTVSGGTSVASRLITVGGRLRRPPGGSEGGRFVLAMPPF